jgi:membrane protein DedA with SNARE-associated domain
MFEKLMIFLENLAGKTSLPLFSFYGSIIDEIIAVVPSPFIPLAAGGLAEQQGRPFSYLFLLALTGTIGKTIASYLTYWIADKLEDVFTESKFAKILGLDKHQLEKYTKYFDGSNKDEIVMVVLRSLPFVSTLPVSVIAGIVKIKPVSFIWTTFVGTYIRFMFFLTIAYAGKSKYEGMLGAIDSMGTIFKIIVLLGLSAWAFMFLRNNWEKIARRFVRMMKKEK